MSEFRPNKKPNARRSTQSERTLLRARSLRQSLSPPEVKLWVRLRGRRLAGLRFRRQHPIGPYIADFYCEAARLVVELDGQSHESRRDHDHIRDTYLSQHGHSVLRITVSQFEHDIPAAMDLIGAHARKRILQTASELPSSTEEISPASADA